MSDKCYIQFAKCVKKQEKKCKYLHKCNFCCNFADFFTRAHNAAHARQNTMKHITNILMVTKNSMCVIIDGK